jgi:hypothetical protein
MTTYVAFVLGFFALKLVGTIAKLRLRVTQRSLGNTALDALVYAMFLVWGALLLGRGY